MGRLPGSSGFLHAPIRRLETAGVAVGVEKRVGAPVVPEAIAQVGQQLGIASQPQREGLVFFERGRDKLIEPNRSQ
jgi:hypothetical protein